VWICGGINKSLVVVAYHGVETDNSFAATFERVTASSTWTGSAADAALLNAQRRRQGYNNTPRNYAVRDSIIRRTVRRLLAGHCWIAARSIV